MLHDLPPAVARLGHGVGAVLAHAHPVAVARDGEGEHPLRLLHGEAGRPQAEQVAGRAAGEDHPAEGQLRHPARRRIADIGDPPRRVPGQHRVRVLGRRQGAHIVRGEGDGGAVVGHLVPLRAVHRHQIGQAIAPHRRRVLRLPRRGGEKYRLDDLTAVGQGLAVGLRHGGGDLGRVRLRQRAPALRGLRRLDVRLAAAGIAAQVRPAALVAPRPQLPQAVGPGAHRLGRQGRRLEGGGHLRRHHPPQVVRHGQLRHRAVLQQDTHRPGPVPAGRRGRGGGRHRRRGLRRQEGRALPLPHRQQGQQQRRQTQGRPQSQRPPQQPPETFSLQLHQSLLVFSPDFRRARPFFLNNSLLTDSLLDGIL